MQMESNDNAPVVDGEFYLHEMLFGDAIMLMNASEKSCKIYNDKNVAEWLLSSRAREAFS